MSEPMILVIEDDPALNSHLVRVLRERWPRTDGVLTAAAAKASLEAARYDLVLLDLMLPDENGLDLLRELQRDGLVGKAVVLTGHGDLPAAIEALRLHTQDFLRKPIEPRVLLARVEAALAAGRADQEAATASGTRRARRFLRLGRRDDAARELEAVRELGPVTAELWNLLGAEAELRHDRVAAAHCYHLALELDPEYGPAQRNSGRLIHRTWRKDVARGGVDLGGEEIQSPG